MELTRRKFIASTGAAMSAVFAAPLAPAGSLVDQSSIQAITIWQPDGHPRNSMPRASVFGIGSGGHDAIAHISKIVFEPLTGPKMLIDRVDETKFGDCENSNIAIFLVGEDHTSVELRRAGEIACSLLREGVLVTVIASRPTMIPDNHSGFACDSWISASGTKGLVDTASAILHSLFGRRYICLDFSDVRMVLAGGAGKSAMIDVPIQMAEGEVPFQHEFSIVTQTLNGAKGALLVIAGNAELSLFQVDHIANYCRRYLSEDSHVVFTDVFDEQCVMPRLTAIGI
jgi:hypothetical protein